VPTYEARRMKEWDDTSNCELWDVFARTSWGILVSHEAPRANPAAFSRHNKCGRPCSHRGPILAGKIAFEQPAILATRSNCPRNHCAACASWMPKAFSYPPAGLAHRDVFPRLLIARFRAP